ncbi:Metallo-dependent phosphatase [Heliocybe sulcata]|uniref:Metallo-dependent phosphatase n=1 Tax=Heliocybe sulcata TaxID=5364 RepID=A0A5C3MWK3_9AGAM|nr:Metallo-dependent phosphatase [Heliocybe sulcata]
MDVPRRAAAFLVLTCFFLYFLAYHERTASLGEWVHRVSDVEVKRDFSKIIHTKTVSAEDIGLDDPNRRIIMVGDIHGMNKSLHHLLSSLSYDPSTDTLFHAGDIVQKGSLSGCLSVLDFLSSNRVRGVRGNHDQTIIEWRTWMEWIKSLKGGKKWLDRVDKEYEKHGGLDDDEEKEMKKRRGKWWSRVPKGWKMFGEHYKIARCVLPFFIDAYILTPRNRAMTQEHYEYMLSLPLILHIPSQHMYIAHGGLLPYNPKRPVDHPKQPLAHLPTLISRIVGSLSTVRLDEEAMRVAQEVELLKEVPQNTDPWVVLNIRDVKDSGKISRKAGKGTPWAKLWNKTVKKCNGFEEAVKKGKNRDGLPCMPSTVVYGHTAKRGLDVHRWTVGLDSGCSHGRSLTALVVSGADLASDSLEARSLEDQASFSTSFLPADDEERALHEDEEHETSRRPKTIPFGDNGVGHLYSVKCPAP